MKHRDRLLLHYLLEDAASAGQAIGVTWTTPDDLSPSLATIHASPSERIAKGRGASSVSTEGGMHAT